MPRFASFRTRAGFTIQVGLLLVIALVLAGLVLTARENILGQGMATGFGFLDRSTGWPVNVSVIELSARSSYARVLLAGLLNTLVVGALALVLATLLGTVLGLMRVSGNLILEIIGTTYVEIFRNVPMILQAFFWYAVFTHLPSPRQAITFADAVVLSNRGLVLPAPEFSATDLGVLALAALAGVAARVLAARRGLRAGRWLALGWLVLAAVLLWAGRAPGVPMLSVPELQGLRIAGGLTLKPEFSALLVGLSLFGAAYIGEIVRGGLLSVEPGKLEAGRALGLTPGQVNRFIRLPLALRAMLPALSNQYIWLMKATTVGIAIGYPDFFAVVSTAINQSGQTLELLAILMLGFLAVNYTLGFALNRLNERLKLKGRS
ncbi:ABC transporter permease subunit [Oceanicella sp. SM1341]|uniref:ABC transporter permease subunit n=1 Tax=Oceanicella sp. SM1341 TaxID=1548889 RepID=UPI0013002C1C|nr:ABC transporter permease subunit [Oceanicella sp. SM1341]